MLRSNNLTDCEDEMILVPAQKEIESAQPIQGVLPADAFQQVTLIAETSLIGAQTGTIQSIPADSMIRQSLSNTGLLHLTRT